MSDNIRKGEEFEKQCLKYLGLLGFENLRLTKNVNDQGADLIGKYGDSTYIFQCKKHKKKQGNRPVQEAIAAKTYYKASRCAIISESGFTKSAFELARPNYCILFTADEISDAVNSKHNFGDLIEGFNFPEYVTVEHDYDVIKRYEEIKAKIGHTPRNSDLDSTTRYHIKRIYGNLSNLISQLGDRPFSRRPTDNEIKNEYIRVKEKVGKIPTLADMELNSAFSRNCFSSYPFTKIQRDCGDAPNIQRGVSKAKLIRAFKELEQKLGRTPTLKDLDESGIYRASYYRNRWGNIDTFLKELGISRRNFKKQLSYDERELIIIYLLLKKIFEIRQDDKDFYLNHTVLEKLKFEENTFISPGTFSNRFESWKQFINYLDGDKATYFEKDLDKIILRLIEDQSDNNDND
ncbi:MAG: restriction endonuclease [Okeania sp. SIO2C9]|uniref:homing endonuclease associated repeat-containing protein n=1 Tax=Okeania sp. SIO2C9 TaxID=2607791 RepID=UPI0013C29BE6|nr:restriction endonuclease [Okeania sp. SIO2C9]NEQ78524.1 restriction endonuclease [Okeania sp. SIO2C9]